jgi:hypothetical protein
VGCAGSGDSDRSVSTNRGLPVSSVCLLTGVNVAGASFLFRAVTSALLTPPPALVSLERLAILTPGLDGFGAGGLDTWASMSLCTREPGALPNPVCLALLTEHLALWGLFMPDDDVGDGTPAETAMGATGAGELSAFAGGGGGNSS